MSEESKQEKDAQEKERPSVSDLRSLAYFYMKRFDQKVNDEKSPKGLKAGFEEKLDAMKEVYTMLGNFHHEGINTTEGVLLELAGQEAKENDPALTEEERATSLRNTRNLREFIESHQDMLPADFLKDKEATEQELKKLEEEK